MIRDGEAAAPRETTPPPVEPAPLEELVENEVPEVQEFFKQTNVPEPTHADKTRKTLALLILIALLCVYLAVFSMFLFGGLANEKFTAAIAGISGLQALAAAAVGFYYGKGQHNHD